MPWSVPDLMSIRLEFVAEVLAGRRPFAVLCALYGISDKTGYKWLARFKTGGPAALTDGPHRPQGCPHRTPEPQRELVLALRRRHPTWGARKLRAVLQEQQPALSWPAASTITTLLHGAGLVPPRRRRPRPGPGEPAPFLTADTPNALWSMDYKGEFTTGDGRYCYPLTLVDSASRYLLACDAHLHGRTAPVRASLERAFRTYGLPQRILSDNGPPFGHPGTPRHFSALSLWLIGLGIRPCFIRPGHPEQNARHERMHRTLKAEATHPPARSCAAQQGRFDAFREEYNRLRPHEALGQTPPARHYHPSEQPLPRVREAPRYPAHYLVRRIAPSGVLNWHQRQIYLSQVFAGCDVGLCPVTTIHYDVYLTEYFLGSLDVHALRFTSLTQALTSPISPV